MRLRNSLQSLGLFFCVLTWSCTGNHFLDFQIAIHNLRLMNAVQISRSSEGKVLRLLVAF